MTSPVTRLSHVALRSPDVEKMRTYYTEIIGLSSYDDGDGTVYLASGGRGPALELRSDTTAGIDHVGFEISASKEEELLIRLRDQGVQVSTATDLEPGLSRIHDVIDVEGNHLQMCVVDDDRAPAALATSGIVPQKIGHVATRTSSAAAVTEFYE